MTYKKLYRFFFSNIKNLKDFFYLEFYLKLQFKKTEHGKYVIELSKQLLKESEFYFKKEIVITRYYYKIFF